MISGFFETATPCAPAAQTVNAPTTRIFTKERIDVVPVGNAFCADVTFH
jgi:hypothetical protein